MKDNKRESAGVKSAGALQYNTKDSGSIPDTLRNKRIRKGYIHKKKIIRNKVIIFNFIM